MVSDPTKAKQKLNWNPKLRFNDLVELIAELTEFDGKIRWDTTKPDGQPRRCLDVSRAEQEFWFRAKTDFREGLKKTVEWYLRSKQINK